MIVGGFHYSIKMFLFAELELAIIKAKVRNEMQNAKSKGVKVGCKFIIEGNIPAIFYKHYPAFVVKQMNVSVRAMMCNLSRPTVYKYLKLMG